MKGEDNMRLHEKFSFLDHWTKPRILVISLISFALVAAGWSAGYSGFLGTTHAKMAVASPTHATPVSLLSKAANIESVNQALIEVAELAKPAVVNISVLSTAAPSQTPSPFFDDPFFRKFFGDEFNRRFQQPEQPQQPEGPKEQGLGSGVIISPDGYIITNNHVVEHADQVRVLLSDKRKFDAKVVGTDPKTDLALIKIDADDLPAIRWGDSSGLRVGEMVMAIGNPFGLNQTVTMGIISAVGRANVGIVDYEDFIQTDAAINPGNSGGALVNLKGELVGINTAIFSRSGGYMGIGFAIPSNMAKSIQQSLIKHGKVVRGWLGVSIQDLTPDLKDQFDAPDTNGVLISDVLTDGPAKKAGIKRGDIIRRYDGKTVNNSVRLRSLVAQTAPDAKVTLEILRDGDTRKLTITIGEMPKNVASLSSAGEAEGNQALAGVRVEPVPPEKGFDEGVSVTSVQTGSPADQAGIRKGDIILEINRHSIKDVEDFRSLTQALGPDDRVLVLLKRGRGTIFLSITP